MRDLLLDTIIPVLVAALCFYCIVTPLDQVYWEAVHLFRFVFHFFL